MLQHNRTFQILRPNGFEEVENEIDHQVFQTLFSNTSYLPAKFPVVYGKLIVSTISDLNEDKVESPAAGRAVHTGVT